MKKSFEETLKKMMLEKNITSKKIASITGLSKGAISQILNGKKESQKCNISKPNYIFLKNIIWAFDFTNQEKEELFDTFSSNYNLLPEGIIKNSIYAEIILCAIKNFTIHGMYYIKDKEFYDSQFQNHIFEKIDTYSKKQILVMSMAEYDKYQK